MTRALVLTCAALGLLAGCETDDSLPTRPRTANGGIFGTDEKNQANAEQRSMEKPQRDLPIHGSDLPGQQSAVTPAAGSPVVALDNTSTTPAAHAQTHFLGWTGPSGWRAFGHMTGPATAYYQDFYPGLVPHVPLNPGTIPIPGATPIPGGDFSLDHSWGQGLTLTSTAHRDWSEITAHYQTADVQHQPVYFFDVQQQLPVKQNDGTYRADVKTGFMDIPGFFLNAAALPVLLTLEPLDAKRTTSAPIADPNFLGYLPPGPVVASPTEGVLKWEYPFLNPDGTVRVNKNQESGAPTSRP